MRIFSPGWPPCKLAMSVGMEGWPMVDCRRRPSEETGLSFFCPEGAVRQEGLSSLCLVSPYSLGFTLACSRPKQVVNPISLAVRLGHTVLSIPELPLQARLVTDLHSRSTESTCLPH